MKSCTIDMASLVNSAVYATAEGNKHSLCIHLSILLNSVLQNSPQYNCIEEEVLFNHIGEAK